MKHRPPASLTIAALALFASSTVARAGLHGPPPMETSAPAPTDHDTPAHAPDFQNKKLWPHFTGKEEYARQEWPKARLLVWSGGHGKWTDAGKWLENGKPAETPPDRNTDVILPAADTFYAVKAAKCHVRHVTVGRNGSIEAGKGGPANHFNIWGNCWIKEGGRIFFISPVGVWNTFVRRDGALKPPPKKDGLPPFDYGIGDKMTITKYRGASVEFLGVVGTCDEVYVAAGKTIIGPYSEFRYNAKTNNGIFEVHDGATLEMQSGSSLTIDRGTVHRSVSVYPGGTLQAGSPDRPISKDAIIRLHTSGGPGFICCTRAKMRVYSQDPTKARLVFTSRTPKKTLTGGARGIIATIGGDVELNGVVFDYFGKGGVQLTDMAMRRQWKNVTLGPHNSVKGEEIFAQAGGASYNRASKFRIYIKPALGMMKKFEDTERKPGEE